MWGNLCRQLQRNSEFEGHNCNSGCKGLVNSQRAVTLSQYYATSNLILSLMNSLSTSHVKLQCILHGCVLGLLRTTRPSNITLHYFFSNLQPRLPNCQTSSNSQVEHGFVAGRLQSYPKNCCCQVTHSLTIMHECTLWAQVKAHSHFSRC